MSRATGFRYQSLTPEQADAIRVALGNGVSYRALAGEYGVSERTIHRCREAAPYAVVTVSIGGWRARHRIESDGPLRIEPWRPA